MLHVPEISILPAILLGITVGLGLLGALLLSLRNAYWFIAAMLFLSSISIVIDYFKNVYAQWILPLQWYRSDLFGALGVAFVIGLLPRMGHLSFFKVSLPAWALLLIGVYAGLLRMYHVSPNDGVMTAGLAIVSIIPIAVVIPVLLQQLSDCRRLLRLIVWVGALWSACVAIQLVINPDLLLLGAGFRFTGLIGNCNQAATMLSVMATCAVWLALNNPKGRRIYAGLAGIFLIQLMWTGSRGGMGMFSLGLAAVLYTRLGRAVLMLPVLAVAFLGALWLLGSLGIDLRAEQLLRTDNTRGAGWWSLLNSGLSSPLVGVGTEEIEASENSYLLGFATFGVGMLTLTLLLLAVGINQMVQLVRVRRYADKEWRTVIDICLGHHVMFFAGAVFEGFIHARVGVHPVMMLLFAGIARFILDVHMYAPVEAEYLAAPEDIDYDESATHTAPA